MSQTLKFGNKTWATKVGSTLAYNDLSGNYKPLPFNFTRSTSATRVNKEGLIEVVTNDRPRIDYTDTSDGVLLLEKAATNLITYSEGFINSSWIKLGSASASVPILTSNYAISPDGIQNATRLQCDLNGGTTTSDQSIIYESHSPNTSKTISIYLKSNNGQNQEVYFANTIGVNDTVVITTEWKRYVFTHSSSDSNLTLGSRGSTGSADVLDILIWGAQSESGNVASSYIPTQGSASTRVAETASGAGNSEVFNDSEGVLFVDTSSVNDGQYKFIGISDGTNSNRLGLFIGNSNNKMSVESVGSGTNLGIYDKGIVTENNNKIGLKYKTNNCSLWVNGFEIGVDTSFAAFTNGTLTELSFDRGDGNFDFYGKTKEIGYYDTILTDLELETLTSYKSWTSMVNELNLNIIYNG